MANFLIELRGRGAAGHTSRHKDIIKVGMNITFHMVLRVASRFQFFAGLMAMWLWWRGEGVAVSSGPSLAKCFLRQLICMVIAKSCSQ